MQLNTPLNNKPVEGEEEVIVTDPCHPLYNRRFIVAYQPSRFSTKEPYVLVFYKDGINLRISLDAVKQQKIGQVPRTKLSYSAVYELVCTAREYGACPWSPNKSGSASPTR